MNEANALRLIYNIAMDIDVHVCIYIYMYMYMHLYTCAYKYMHVFMYIYICTLSVIDKGTEFPSLACWDLKVVSLSTFGVGTVSCRKPLLRAI